MGCKTRFGLCFAASALPLAPVRLALGQAPERAQVEDAPGPRGSLSSIETRQREALGRYRRDENAAWDDERSQQFNTNDHIIIIQYRIPSPIWPGACHRTR